MAVDTGISDRLRGARSAIRRRLGADRVYRVAVAVVGGAVVVGGVALVPLPGPGWVIVFFGLGLLATEFTWASRLQRTGRALLGRWTAWLRERSVGVRAALGVAAAAALAGLAWLYVAVVGLPGWLPHQVADVLDRVPGLV